MIERPKVKKSVANVNGINMEQNQHKKQKAINATVRHLIDDAKDIIEAWRVDYNTERPHSSLGGKTPEEFAIFAQTPLRPRRCAASASAPSERRGKPESTPNPNQSTTG